MELHPLCFFFLSYQLEINTTAATTRATKDECKFVSIVGNKVYDSCYRSTPKIVISTNSDVFSHSKIGDEVQPKRGWSLLELDLVKTARQELAFSYLEQPLDDV